ncbi:hypothetical protein B0H34DRAFT_687141 [Crassisporium funariophilum]|nr:hypothetical protein B0H34DRAFT_687141 [Crassisporium funariophilum]
MATSVPSIVGAGSPSSPARWGRSGEPGSAFNGLSRGIRGRGRGGGGGGPGRGGRGGGRGGASTRESARPEDNNSAPRADSSQSTPAPSARPSASSATAPLSDKPNALPASASSKPKPPSRRTSRSIPIPPAVVTQLSQPVESAPSSPSSRPSNNRRRRSQVGKPGSSVPPKINPPALNDSLSRPNKPRLAPVPHTAPIKDTPPHLNQKLDVRSDIDALVERVRAVAMDHRPSTPRSHIDWAGDDDDSLPDLDDWGVTPATFASSQSDVISPIIVDGLRPLPDVASNSILPSPATLVQELVVDKPDRKVLASSQVKLTTHAGTIVRKALDLKVSSQATSPSPSPPSTHAVPSTQSASNSANKKLLHPSLPAKPASAGASVAHLKSRPGAAPMRAALYPKTPISAPSTKETFHDKVPITVTANAEPTTSDTSVGTDEAADSNVSIVVEPIDADKGLEKSKVPEHLKIVEPSTGDSAFLSAALERELPNYTQTSREPLGDSVEGLAASIHAPKAITDSASAPANLSSYSDLSSDSRGPTPTHTRAHTVGRPPSFPRPNHQAEYTPRFSRSGHSTPRGGFQQGGYHARTHSSPPAGVVLNQHHQQRSPHATRPVITGGAISMLARTIVKTNNHNLSPPKPQSVIPLVD